MPAPSSTLSGWNATAFTGGGLTYDVYAKSPVTPGPGVVVIPEVPGLTPEVLGFADHLVDAGFSVAVPSLFGTPGRAMSASYALATIAKLCVASEMRAFATGADRPISRFLRALAVDVHARTPGRGVGVVGMCFTGGFALATAVEESVLAAVMSQPSVPFSIGGRRRSDVGLSQDEIAAVQGRTADGLCLMGLRFSGDRLLSGDRFDAYARAFGDAIELIVLDSSRGNPGGYGPTAHSVLTGEVREDPANSAYEAREQVIGFLRRQLS